MKNFRNIQVDESNILTWQGLIVPVSHYLLLLSPDRHEHDQNNKEDQGTLRDIAIPLLLWHVQ